jgi:septal ring factor EnvC (AmiA/AmiB activator)
LIIEISGGYLVVLAGLDRLDVRPDDAVLAGEPVGVMSKFDHEPRLYFELRLNGRGMSPAPYIAVALRKRS